MDNKEEKMMQDIQRSEEEDRVIAGLPEHLREACKVHGVRIVLFCLNRMTFIQAGQEILHKSRVEVIQDRARKMLAAGDHIAQMVVADQGWTEGQIEEAVKGIEEAVRRPRIIVRDGQLH